MKKQYIKYLLIVISIFFFFSSAQANELSDYKKLIDSHNKIIKQLNPDIADKWDNFVESRHMFDNERFQFFIETLNNNYDQFYKKFTQCSKERGEKERKYPGNLLKDLQSKFSKEQIIKKKITIKKIVGFLCLSRNINHCPEIEEKLIFSETQISYAFNEYAKSFLDFIETLDEKNKKSLSSNKEKVEKILIKFNKKSMLLFIESRGLEYLYCTSELENYSKSEPEITKFLLQHSFFKESYNLMQVYKDIEEIK